MLAMSLLAGSVSVGRALVPLMGMQRGYDVKGIGTVSVSLEGTTHQLAKQQLAYFEEVLGRVRNIRFVRSASATEFLPLYASGFVGGPFGVDGRPAKLTRRWCQCSLDISRQCADGFWLGGKLR